MPNSPFRQRTTWLVLIALAFLALIPFAIHQADNKKEEENSSQDSKKLAYRGSSPSKNSRTRRSNRIVSQKLPPSHKTEELKDFLLPPSEMHDVSLEEALDILFTQYRDICQETGESPIRFRYGINGEAEQIVFAKLHGDFLSNLKYLAAMAGTTVEVKDHELLFTEIEDGPIVQRRWTVPPTFSYSILPPPEIAQQNDPFGGAVTPPSASEKKTLRDIGVFKDDETFSFLRSSSTLIVRAGKKSLSQIDGLVETSISRRPMQSRLRFLNEGDQLPSIVLRSGNLGTIERNGSPNGPDIQLLTRATELGFGRKVEIVSFTGESPTHGARDLYLQTGNIADLGVSENLTFATYNLPRSENGQPQTFTFKDENGTLHERTFVAERIDGTGRVLSMAGD